MATQGQPGQPGATGAGAGPTVRTPRAGGGMGGGAKPFFMTSEFLAAVVAVIALLIAGLASDALDANTVWTLVSVITFGYILSRGIAKAGKREAEY